MKKPTIIVTGSIAYDLLLEFDGQFKDQALDTQNLNLSLFITEMKREFGGCAANIAYTFKQLGVDATMVATIGEDDNDYTQWLEKNQIHTDYLHKAKQVMSAQALIISDKQNNQITAFHPGAMNLAHHNLYTKKATLGIVSPNGYEAMVQQAQCFYKSQTPFFFDPGQGLPMFEAEVLADFLSQASWVICNDHEAKLLNSKMNINPQQLLEKFDNLQAFITTQGSSGCEVFTPHAKKPLLFLQFNWIKVKLKKPLAVVMPLGQA